MKNARIIILILVSIAPYGFAVESFESNNGSELFSALKNEDWKTVFVDPCTDDWEERWFLDGKKATVENGKDGMKFSGGPKFRDDRHHAVLWTRESFKGDIRIDYEYTRLDEAMKCVTILYIQASGSGKKPYDKDIAEWNELREVPHMWMYYRHMNAYHISYAAFPMDNEDPENDYIRARRYMPEMKKGLKGTDLKPDYVETGLFETGVPHQVTVIKAGDDLFMWVRNPKKTWLGHWKTDKYPSISEGRVGLRHMYTRTARYKDFKVSVR